MISLHEARQLIRDHVAPLSGERSALDQSLGHVLALDVMADAYYPSGDRSQMDGYLVRVDAVPGEFRVVGEIPAGVNPTVPVGIGECWRIFTGALLPPGGGRVVMQEDVVRKEDTISVAAFSARTFVRERGSEASPGDVILPAGTALGPSELAILAQVGEILPKVVPMPKVHHVATGGELVDPAQEPESGQIRDTNSCLLEALFSGLGVTSFSTRRVRDDLETLVEAAETSDELLIISGGASVGDYDFGAAALKQLGYTVHFNRVNLRPGKPLTFATRGRQAAFLLPGNPVSHFVCFHAAVRMAVELFSGRSATWPALRLPIHGGVAVAADPRETWWPARATVVEGNLCVAPQRWSTSGDTFSLVGTNALMLVNADSPKDGAALTLIIGTF